MSDLLYSGISPITLLPIRLETRFYPYERRKGVSPDELHIRIYPDTIHIDTHEKELTEYEVQTRKQFWMQVLKSEDNEEVKNNAFNQLALELGVERASWVARVLRPIVKNNTKKSTKKSINSIETPNVELKESSWTRPAIAKMLPTKWRAVGILGNEKVTSIGKNIITTLPFSIDSLSEKTEIDWLINFEKAIDVGMAIKLKLTPAMKLNGLDKLLVYGIKENQNGACGANELNELFNSHYYTDGFEFIEPGTPTNNTEIAFSGYDINSPNYISQYQVFKQDAYKYDENSSVARTAKYIGISLPEEGKLENNYVCSLAYAANRDINQEFFAKAVNEGLWASTWGYFLSQLLVDSDNGYKVSNLSNIEENAYYKYLERENLKDEDWFTAENEVIAEVLFNDQILLHTDGKIKTWDESLIRAKKVQSNIDNIENFIRQWTNFRMGGKPYSFLDLVETKNVLYKKIKLKAYLLWIKRGCTTGNEKTDWYQAQQAYRNKVAKYAHDRWLWRQSINMYDTPENDWYAGERAVNFTAQSIMTGRKHFVEYVRPAGPIPAIRISNQPYGILPVTSLESWQPSENENNLTHLVNAINILKNKVWLPSVSNVSRIGCNENESENKELSDLLSILMTSPLSQEFDASIKLSSDYVNNLLRLANANIDSDLKRTLFEADSRKILDSLGISWLPRLFSLVGSQDVLTVPIPLIGEKDKEILDWFMSLKNVTLLEALKNDDKYLPENLKGSKSLLYLLLRHSCLREYIDAAIKVLAEKNLLADYEHLDADLINMKLDNYKESTSVVWELFDRKIKLDEPNGSSQTFSKSSEKIMTFDKVQTNNIFVNKKPRFQKVSSYIERNYRDCNEDSPLYGLKRFIKAIEIIKDAPIEQLDQLFRQTLDCASHRLDAWITSFATRRLSEIRESGVGGTLIGGFGWVENLKAREGENTISPSSCTKKSDGYIHAPSLQQAVTAGVIRSAYLAHASDNGNSCAINLSSARVRQAQWLLDGMRQGQTLSSLLGYQFEKELHKGHADEYLDEFRAIAPLENDVIVGCDDSDDANSYISTKPNTLDGLKLHDIWKNSPNIQLSTLLENIRKKSINNYSIIISALNALDEAFDSVSDALIAESIHQTANSNPERASAILNMLSRGEGSIPQLEFTQTPRTGKNIVHRIVALNSCNEASNVWPVANRYRAIYSAELEKQIEKMLPSPNKVRCNVTAKNSADEAIAIDVYLSECELCALDYIYEAQLGSDKIPLIVKLSVINAACKKSNIPVDYTAEIDFNVNSSFIDDEITVTEFIRTCALLRQVLGKSRALTYNDVISPDTENIDKVIEQVEGVDLTDIAQSAQQLLREINQKVSNYINSNESITVEECYSLFIQATGLGINGAAEAMVRNTKDSACAVNAEIEKRIKELDKLNINATVSDKEAQQRYNIKIIKTVFGEELLITPAFKILFADSFNEGAAYGKKIATPSTVRRWFGNVSRVHKGSAVFNRYLLAGSALRINRNNSFSAIQLPTIQDEKWVGSSLDKIGLDSSKLNLVIFGDKCDADYNFVSGFVIDEWNETNPNEVETTGIAFHYDTPGAEPPQSILIAVQPDINDKKWTSDMLEKILFETLELSKIRAVGRNELNDLGQILPAIYLTNNLNNDTVSTELFPNANQSGEDEK